MGDFGRKGGGFGNDAPTDRMTRETMRTTIVMVACEQCVKEGVLDCDDNPTGAMFPYDARRHQLRIDTMLPLLESGKILHSDWGFIVDAFLCERHELVSPNGIIRLSDFDTISALARQTGDN